MQRDTPGMSTHQPSRSIVRTFPQPVPQPAQPAGANGAGAAGGAGALGAPAFRYLAAGEGKRQWTGCRTADRPLDSGKKYGFHKAVHQLVAGLLEDNGVALTAGLQEFVDTRSGTVRVSDCRDFPAEQGKYVLNDVLLGAGIVDMPNHLARFFERNIENARDASGSLVPSGNPRVSFPSSPNLRGICFHFYFSDFVCFWYKC